MSSGVADAEGQPDQRRDEREVVARVEDDDLVALVQVLAQLERGGQAGEAGSDDDDALGARGGHGAVLLSVRQQGDLQRSSGEGCARIGPYYEPGSVRSHLYAHTTV